MITRGPFFGWTLSLTVTLFAIGVFAMSQAVLAAPTAEQRKLARRCEEVLKVAKQLVDDGDVEKAVRYVKLTQEKVAELEAAAEPDDRQWSVILKPLKRRLDQARGTLELEGFNLPAIKVAPKSPSNGNQPLPSPQPSEEFKPDPNNVSFKHEVAPILLQRCGGCHGGRRPKGDLSMATFRLLARGVGGSAIIDPGESNISQMIEVIRDGDMPKGGGKVSRGELALLAKWIDQGAKFDGGNADTPLREIVAANGSSNPTNPVPTTPAEPGQIAFSTHVAPILAQHCTNCHGGQRPRNQLNLSSFQLMMRGGMNGAAIQPGKPSGSLLIQKIKGTAADGARMPLNAAPLSANVIADIEKWVAAGAKFDGPDPDLPVSQVAALAVAKNSNHQQLRQIRSEQADKN
ncbi:MAG: c-type cytochrome domain-containing protein [Pirellulales bacterium]